MRYTIILLVLGLVLAGCTDQSSQKPEPLYNETLNEQLENLTTNPIVPANFTLDPDPLLTYEIARDDVFSDSNGNFTSYEIGFLGVKLGATKQQVIAKLGNPDVQFTPADKSFTNLEYRKAIGIDGITSGISYQLINGTVQRIMIRPPFNPFLQGNTSLGQNKLYFYNVWGDPDYQDFTRYNSGFNYRIFYYVEKGVELYLRKDMVEVMAFVPPREFNGIEWVSRIVILSDGSSTNITEPRLK